MHRLIRLGLRKWKRQRREDKADLTQYQLLELPPSFTFHYGNAWEEASGVIRFDACRRNDASVLFGGFQNVMHGRTFNQGAPSECTQITLNLQKGTAKEEVVGGETEFPRVDARVSGRRNRYVYYTVRQPDTSTPHPLFNAVARYDMETGQPETFTYPAQICAEEHLFVSRPGGISETDGWLFGTGLDIHQEITQVAIFDAARLADGPLAIVRLPYWLPLGFRGNFASAQA